MCVSLSRCGNVSLIATNWRHAAAYNWLWLSVTQREPDTVRDWRVERLMSKGLGPQIWPQSLLCCVLMQGIFWWNLHACLMSASLGCSKPCELTRTMLYFVTHYKSLSMVMNDNILAVAQESRQNERKCDTIPSKQQVIRCKEKSMYHVLAICHYNKIPKNDYWRKGGFFRA